MPDRLQAELREHFDECQACTRYVTSTLILGVDQGDRPCDRGKFLMQGIPGHRVAEIIQGGDGGR